MRAPNRAVLGLLSALLPLSLALASCAPDRKKAVALADAAQQQLEAGDVVAAAQSIEKAIRESDDIADLFLLRARIALAANQLPEALQSYRQAADLEPDNLDALRGLAQISFQLGRGDDAERAVKELLARSPADPSGRLIKGLVALSRCRPKEGLQQAEAMLADNPADEGGLILKARSLFALHREEEALALLDKGVSQNAESSGILLTRLEIDRLLVRADALANDFVVLRRLQPRNTDLLVQHMNFLYKSGDVAGARREAAAYLVTADVQPEVLDRILRIWRQYDATPLSPAQQAAIRGKGARTARIMVAAHYLEAGQGGAALEQLRGLEGSDVSGLEARVLLAAGHRAEAEDAASKIIAHDKTQCEALLALAGAYLGAGRGEEAAARAQDSAAQCPQQWLAYLTMADAGGRARTEMDRITAAALTADPQNGALARELAKRWVSRGEVGRAVAVARRVTRSAPGQQGGWSLLQELCAKAGDMTCVAEARQGLARAGRMYAIDPAPGSPPLLGGSSIGCRGPETGPQTRPEAGEADQTGRTRSRTITI